MQTRISQYNPLADNDAHGTGPVWGSGAWLIGFITMITIHCYTQVMMHQSFISPTSLGAGNSGSFNFSIFKAPLKNPALRGQLCGKIPAKSPGSPESDHNVEQQLRVVLMKLKYVKGALICACKSTGTFAN